jgi:hypothetical protein
MKRLVRAQRRARRLANQEKHRAEKRAAKRARKSKQTANQITKLEARWRKQRLAAQESARKLGEENKLKESRPYVEAVRRGYEHDAMLQAFWNRLAGKKGSKR